MASENGWEPLHAGPDILEWVTVPGTNVHLQVMKGWPSAILKAYAADYNAFVEPLRDADSASFTATNSVATSNHLNGTAMDLNWNSHPFRVSNAGYNPAMITTMREILAFYTYKGVQVMWWAQDWNTPKDAMHHQMGYNTWNNPVTGEFIARFIRADGFSTFRRGGASNPGPLPPVVVSKADGYAIKIIREGARRKVTPRGQQIALSVALVESGMQMYANSNVPESMNIPHDKVGTDHDSVGLFQQRCPMWGPANILMDPTLSAGLFYDRLVKLDYNGSRPPGDYAADVQRPAAQYRGRYQERMADAVALYNRLANSTAPEGDDALSAEAERMIKEMYDEYKGSRRAPSRSFFAKDQAWGETSNGFLWNVDGNVNEMYMTWGYLLGVSSIESDVEYIAANGVAPESWAGSMDWLAEVGQQWCQGLIALRGAMQKSFRAAGVQSVTVGDKAPQIPQVQTVYVDRPAPVPTGDTADHIAALYRANSAVLNSDIEKDAADQLVNVIQTKTGGTQA